MNILYYHTSIWCDFFSSLLAEYARTRGCRIGIVCPERFKHVYAANFAAGAVHFLAPDPGAESEWEKNPSEVERLTALVSECEAASGKALGRHLLASERSLGAGYTLDSYYWFSGRLRNRCLHDSSFPARAASDNADTLKRRHVFSFIL